MLTRRDLIASGGVLTQLYPEDAAAAQRTPSDTDALLGIANAIRELRQVPGGGQVTTIRERQRAFLRQNQHYPDYNDVGLIVWERLLEWHAFTQQELKLSRGPDGRYLMEFTITHLVLRPDIGDNEIGLA